jgi:hypothetical protein
MQTNPRRPRRITLERKEYAALMSERPAPKIELKSAPDFSEIEEKLRKINFYLMILVGLILVVLVLCKGN